MLVIALKKVNRDVHVVVESGEEVIIRYDLFIKYGLRKGDDINDERISSLVKANNIFLAKERAFNILSKRNNSTSEIRRKLVQRKFDKDIADIVVEDLKVSGFLDDEKFSREYIEEKLKFKSVGLNKIRSELYSKGIPKGIIETVLAEKSQADESENAFRIAIKKMNSSVLKNTETKKQKQKIYSFLLSKGFEHDTIDYVIKKIFTDSEENQESFI